MKVKVGDNIVLIAKIVNIDKLNDLVRVEIPGFNIMEVSDLENIRGGKQKKSLVSFDIFCSKRLNSTACLNN